MRSARSGVPVAASGRPVETRAGKKHTRLEDIAAERRRGRGRARASDELVAAAKAILAETHPCSVRGVCYQLFIRGVISSMAISETSRVSRNLVYAREVGIIPWSHIVDETREAERAETWTDPAQYARVVAW